MTTHRLNYREAGPTDSPNALVLVHGFPFSAAMWRPQLDSPPAGWRVIAPDLPGFGESAPVDGDMLSMDAAADAVAELIRGLGLDRVVLGGLSMGGYVCFAFMRRHPQLVRGLILADTRPGADGEQVRRGRLQSAAKISQGGTGELVEGMLPKLLSPLTLKRQPEVEAEVRSIMEAASPAGVIAALHGMAARPDSTPELRSVTVPTLIVVGMDDVITPPGEAQLMSRGIPGSRIEPIVDAGHLPNLEQPAEFNRLLNGFLASVSV
ncbi:MAG TPA: alpha/beta fold hydrolase [Longimicrobiales bacterium]|nr:alpha/beta fold hydrolase [Longimicrobiales bacterium]